MLALWVLLFLTVFSKHRAGDLPILRSSPESDFLLPDLNLPCEELKHQNRQISYKTLNNVGPVDHLEENLADIAPGKAVLSSPSVDTNTPTSQRPKITYNKPTECKMKCTKKTEFPPNSDLPDEKVNNDSRKNEESLSAEAFHDWLNFPTETWDSLREFFFNYKLEYQLLAGSLAMTIKQPEHKGLMEGLYRVSKLLDKVSQWKKKKSPLQRAGLGTCSIPEEEDYLVNQEIELQQLTKRQKVAQEEYVQPEITAQKHNQSWKFYFSALEKIFLDAGSDEVLNPRLGAEVVKSQQAQDGVVEHEKKSNLFFKSLGDQVFLFGTIRHLQNFCESGWQVLGQMHKDYLRVGLSTKEFDWQASRMKRYVWYYANESGKEEIRRMCLEKRNSVKSLIRSLNNWRIDTRCFRENKILKGFKNVNPVNEFYDPPRDWANDVIPAFVYITILIDKYIGYSSYYIYTQKLVKLSVHDSSFDFIRRALLEVANLPAASKKENFARCFTTDFVITKTLVSDLYKSLNRPPSRIGWLQIILRLLEIWAVETKHPIFYDIMFSQGALDPFLIHFIYQLILFETMKKFLFPI